jgi:hypothetical protein
MIGYYFISMSIIGLLAGILFLISRINLHRNGLTIKGVVEKNKNEYGGSPVVVGIQTC